MRLTRPNAPRRLVSLAWGRRTAAATTSASASAPFGLVQRRAASIMSSQRSLVDRFEKNKHLNASVRFFGSAGGSESWTMNVPSMGDSITEGTIIEWVKQPGDWVDADDVLVSIETDKVSVDVRAEQSGFVEEQLATEGDSVEVGSPLVKLKAGEKPAESAAAAEKPAESKPEQPAKEEPAPQQQQEAKPQQQQSEAPAQPKPQAQPTQEETQKPPSFARTEKRVAMNRMRKRIAQRLKDAQNVNAMLTTFQEVDMSALMNMRKTYKDAFEKKHGVRLGFMSAFVKASAAALQEIPAVNGVIDGGDIVYRDYVDVSVAVASPRGLVVPVIRNAESMSFAQVEQSMNDLATKARNNQISLEEMAGGTFTISNGGVFGSMLGTPIINPPQSAILGMHATKMRPVAIDGKVEIRPVMYLALTYDHRLIDGREAVTFLCSIRDKIEDPNRFLLEV